MIHARNCKISGFVFWGLAALTLVIFISGSTSDFLEPIFGWIAGIPTWFGQEAWNLTQDSIIDATLLLTIIFSITALILLIVSFHLYNKELEKYVVVTKKATKAVKVLTGASTNREAKKRLKLALKEKRRREKLARKEEEKRKRDEIRKQKELLHEAKQNKKIADMQKEIDELKDNTSTVNNVTVNVEKTEIKPEHKEPENKPAPKHEQPHTAETLEDRFSQMFRR